VAEHRLKGDALAQSLGLVIAPGSVQVGAGRFHVRGFASNAGEVEYGAEDLEIDDLAWSTTDGVTRVTGAALLARNAYVRAGGVELRAGRLALPGGAVFTTAGAIEVFAPKLELSDAVLTVPDVGALGGAAAKDGGDDAELEPATPPGADASLEPVVAAEAAGGAPLDVRVLDAIDGQLNIDLFLDTTVPLLGRRRATHRFRVPVERGMVDYRGLEDSLHWLEDAFLDIELVDGKLVLEQNVPLVPFTSKALVWWNLDEEGMKLGRRRLVRLRCLLDPQLPPSSGKKRRVTLHKIACRNVELDFTVRGPTEVALGPSIRFRLGDEEHPGIDGLHARGTLQHAIAETLDATTLALGLTALRGAVDTLAVGPVELSMGALELGSVKDAALEFRGFSPGRLVVPISALTAETVRLRVA
jgi:hypothetical protein